MMKVMRRVGDDESGAEKTPGDSEGTCMYACSSTGSCGVLLPPVRKLLANNGLCLDSLLFLGKPFESPASART